MKSKHFPERLIKLNGCLKRSYITFKFINNIIFYLI